MFRRGRDDVPIARMTKIPRAKRRFDGLKMLVDFEWAAAEGEVEVEDVKEEVVDEDRLLEEEEEEEEATDVEEALATRREEVVGVERVVGTLLGVAKGVVVFMEGLTAVVRTTADAVVLVSGASTKLATVSPVVVLSTVCLLCSLGPHSLRSRSACSTTLDGAFPSG